MGLRNHCRKFSRLLGLEKSRCARERAALAPLSRRTYHAYRDICNADPAAGGGRRRLRSVRRVLDEFDNTIYMRESHQREVHDYIVRACIPLIFDAEIGAEYANIVAENDWPEPLHQEVAIRMPRRWGKTMSVAQAIVALVMSVPGIIVGLFAPSHRQSKELLDIVRNLMRYMHTNMNLQYNPVSDSKERLEIIHPNGRISKIEAYPCNPQIRIALALPVCRRTCASQPAS